MAEKGDALEAFVERKEWVPFYGVDNTLFKLGDDILEAVEDASDGYRSYLESIIAKPDAKAIFPARPVAMVKVREVERPSRGGYDRFDGYELYDENGHVWLTVGTDAYDDYYPTFTFQYEPSGATVT